MVSVHNEIKMSKTGKRGYILAFQIRDWTKAPREWRPESESFLRQKEGGGEAFHVCSRSQGSHWFPRPKRVTPSNWSTELLFSTEQRMIRSQGCHFGDSFLIQPGVPRGSFDWEKWLVLKAFPIVGGKPKNCNKQESYLIAKKVFHGSEAIKFFRFLVYDVILNQKFFCPASKLETNLRTYIFTLSFIPTRDCIYN